MANTKLVRDDFTIPMPKPGDGTKIMCRPDGSLYCSWDRPAARMALDAALPGTKSGGYGSADVDLDAPDSSGDDLRDQIHQLLEGKLDPADIEALLTLIEGPDDTNTAVPAQDRKRQARDQRLTMPSKAEILRRIAASGEVRAARAAKGYEALVARFPALKSARVA
jgi:hypothetical protein